MRLMLMSLKTYAKCRHVAVVFATFVICSAIKWKWCDFSFADIAETIKSDVCFAFGNILKRFLSQIIWTLQFANANIVVVLKQLMAQNIVSELIDEWLMTSVQLLVCNGGVPYLVADKYLWTFEEIFAHNWQCQKRTLAPFIKEKQGNSFWNWDKNGPSVFWKVSKIDRGHG